MKEIRNFADFCAVLCEAGFSMGGGNADGIFAAVPWSWDQPAPYPTPVRWHTGDAETDPWEWRMRVLDERDDIAYAKLFFGKSGYLTKEWYPLFLAVRRNGETAEDAYRSGTLTPVARRIYETIERGGAVALHEIKRLGGFSREENAQFERGLTELQLRMFVTMCGRRRKQSASGQEYGWNSTVFCTVEDFWQQRDVRLPVCDPNEACVALEQQVLRLNPDADGRKIRKFIRGK